MLSLLTSSWLRPLLRELSYCCFSSFISIQHSMNSSILDLTPYIAVSSQCSVKVMPLRIPLESALCWESYPTTGASPFSRSVTVASSGTSRYNTQWTAPSPILELLVKLHISQCQASVKVMPLPIPQIRPLLREFSWTPPSFKTLFNLAKYTKPTISALC